MTSLLECLRAMAREDQILEREPMARHTTFRVGGRADVVFLPESPEQVVRAIEAARIAESKLEKQALLEEYRRELEAKGISPDDVLEIVNQEIEMYDGQR